MKRWKEITMRMIPVLLVFVVTLSLSVVIYRTMIKREVDNCWNGLEMATHDVAKEVHLRFEDNLTILDLAADAIMINTEFDDTASVMDYLAEVRKSTIFERIDILYPDERLISQVNGEDLRPADRRSYQELLEAGTHLSTRTKDPYTQKDCFYYFTPVVSDGNTYAILIGAIDCASLANVFVSEHYNDQAQIFMIDRRDGSFLLDKWHQQLGNVYDLGALQLTEEFQNVDFAAEVMSGKTDKVAFTSETNGKVSFMTYMPVETYPFSVSLFIQEDTVFKNVVALRSLLLRAGVVVVILLLLYLVWNVYIVAIAVKNQERARLAELEQEKNEAKTRFLSSVSHDIRTPLNGIIGMLDVIKLKGNVPDHMQDPLHKIDVSAKYLLTLASDVLDLNELDSGKMVFANETVDLRKLADDVGIIMQPRAKLKGVSYALDTSKLTKPYVLGSEVHISKILMNIIGNAIKYNKKNGDLCITIQNSAVQHGSAKYTFVVQDTGIGMSEAFQKNMFHAFEQEQAGARTEQLGYGLGLSIVKRLVDKMNGTIHVESKKNVGTTFTVTLPFPVDNPPKQMGDMPAENVSLQGCKILLAEDNALNMEIAGVMLTEAGAVVTQAANGKCALDTFQNAAIYDFDVILMDIMMPEMDGLEATAKIRALNRPDAKSIPIIAMTASTFSEDIQRCKDAGMNEHIGKPLDMPNVLVKVAKHVKRFRSDTISMVKEPLPRKENRYG